MTLAGSLLLGAVAAVALPSASRGAPTPAEDSTAAAVDVLPKRVLAVSAYRSQAAEVERAVEIVGRGEGQLEVLSVVPELDHVDLRVETVEPGRRYRLVARLRPQSAAGQRAETLRVRTNSGDVPILLLTFLKENVYAAPPELDFGVIDRAELERSPDLAEHLPQTFHVYRRGGGEFHVEIESSLPFLALTRTPGEGAGAVVDIPRDGPTAIFDIEVSPRLDALVPGDFVGEIRIRTDDAQFPLLTVAVRGVVR